MTPDYSLRTELLPGNKALIPLSPVVDTPVSLDTAQALIELGRQYLGTRYRYAGRTPKGFDCAGYVHFLYKHYGYQLGLSSGAQYRQGTKVNRGDLRPGDLVFFGGRRHTRTVGHTGMVVTVDNAAGTFTFIHSSTTRGVIISQSTEPYYATRYIGARRILR